MNRGLFDHRDLSVAFQSVKANHGCAGVDGVTISGFESDLWTNLGRLALELEEGSYLPLPLLRILVDKGNGEGRALSIPCVRDRVVQASAYEQLLPVLEREFEDCSFAYRPGRSVRKAVERIRRLYDSGFRWVVNADIDAFFDSVERSLLIDKLRRYVESPMLVDLIGLWLEAEIWDGESLAVPQRGIPQGSPISPILANLFLDEFDERMQDAGFRLVRYADDFIVLCRSPERAGEALELTHEALARLNLVLDEEEVVSFDDGFEFLGVTFVRSLALVPFDRPKRQRRVLYYPPPLDMEIYLRDKGRRRTIE
jgi:group II intron reverse transcriptase/maturase